MVLARELPTGTKIDEVPILAHDHSPHVQVLQLDDPLPIDPATCDRLQPLLDEPPLVGRF